MGLLYLDRNPIQLTNHLSTPILYQPCHKPQMSYCQVTNIGLALDLNNKWCEEAL